jgi:molybdenum cofactor cytidylyltransferase
MSDIGATSTSEVKAELGVVILAAGRSSRMGRPKLLLPWGETSVLGHLVQHWNELGAGQVAVVTAAMDTALESELERLNFPLANRIRNPAPDRGMFSSIQCAAAWPGWNATLTHWAIVLGDQPHLKLATLQSVVAFAGRQADRVVQPARSGRPRHPVLLPCAAVRELATTTAQDLKAFLAQFSVALCECDDPGLDLDLDRPEDYERARVMSIANL